MIIRARKFRHSAMNSWTCLFVHLKPILPIPVFKFSSFEFSIVSVSASSRPGPGLEEGVSRGSIENSDSRRHRARVFTSPTALSDQMVIWARCRLLSRRTLRKATKSLA